MKQKAGVRTLASLPYRKADFVEPMDCAPVTKLPDGPEWIYELSSMATALLVSNRIVVQCCFLGGTSPSTIIIHTLSTPLASFQKAQWLMEKSSRSTNQAVQALICSKSGCAMHRCGSFTLSLIFSSATIVISQIALERTSKADEIPSETAVRSHPYLRSVQCVSDRYACRRASAATRRRRCQAQGRSIRTWKAFRRVGQKSRESRPGICDWRIHSGASRIRLANRRLLRRERLTVRRSRSQWIHPGIATTRL